MSNIAGQIVFYHKDCDNEYVPFDAKGLVERFKQALADGLKLGEDFSVYIYDENIRQHLDQVVNEAKI